MKKIVVCMIGLLLFPGVLLAQEVEERTVIDAIPMPLNVILKKPGEESRWLLKIKKGCPTLTAGQRIGLGVNGPLNGVRDYLNLGLSRRCDIIEAYFFNQALTVLSATRNHVLVSDESEARHYFVHDGRCGDLQGFLNQPIYANQAGKTLAKGDVLYIPGEPKRCTIKTMLKIEEEGPASNRENVDGVHPATVTHVDAFPRNGKVFLNWRAGSDNVGVDHYVVSWSRYQNNPKKMTFDSAENKTEVSDTRLMVEKLQNETDYYFYVMAVDAAGNQSSHWSEPAHARPLSSISPDMTPQTGQREIALTLVEETVRSFLFRWVMPPTTTRFLISVTANNKPILTFTESPLTRLRVLKTPDRKGKTLKISVSAFNLHTFIGKEELEFSF